jgi:threonine/homoserine/homoserine lactone efflux protein
MALSAGGFRSAAISFVIFSLTMGMLMFVVSLIVAASRQNLLKRIKVVSPVIKRASGVLLILVASFQIYSVLNLESFISWLFP